jgi:hypothetical protein
MKVEALTITGSLTRRDEADLAKVFAVISERHPDVEFRMTFVEQQDALFEGDFTEADLMELITVFRVVERRQSEKDFWFTFTRADLGAEAEAFIKRLFMHIKLEGEEPWFGTIPLDPPQQFYEELHLQAVAQELLPMWVVCNPNTTDFPGKWVATLHLTLPENRVTEHRIVRDSLDEVRKMLPLGLERLERSPNDDPNIVEVWL